jgi:hypothetical protein
MYTVRFYPRGAGAAPAVIISARNGEEIMRELIKRYPEAENIYFDVRVDGVRVYFDLPQEAQAA